MPGDNCLATHCYNVEDFNVVTVAGTPSCLCF